MTNEIPTLTRDQMDEAKALGQRAWTMEPHGKPRKCPTCGEVALRSRHDLTWEEARGAVFMVLGGLSGARCDVCGDTWFDSGSYHTIERHRARFTRANFEVKVAKVGGNALGMYFPRDLARNLELKAGLRGVATPVSDHAFIVELQPEVPEKRKTVRRARLRAVDDALGI